MGANLTSKEIGNPSKVHAAQNGKPSRDHATDTRVVKPMFYRAETLPQSDFSAFLQAGLREDVAVKQPVSAGLPAWLEVDDLADVDYPFENIVFEGGGSQGSAYTGAIMELERLGISKNLRRFAGASIGAATATMLALGYGSPIFLQMINDGPNWNDFLDAKCGMCSLVPNVLRNFGWNPGEMLFNWLGDRIEEKLGNSNGTFKDLYDQTGRELCIVVTNLTLMMEEYCHVKTTPDLPIRTAVRMSVALPVVYGAVKKKHMGRTDIYVDGGLICNYPIHCYDGWWLSMTKEDNFFKRMQRLEDVGKLLSKKERFGKFNEKTIGLITISDFDSHVLSFNTETLAPIAPIPNTPLARTRNEQKMKGDLDARQHQIVTDAMSRFLKVLSDSNIDDNDIIDREEFHEAFRQGRDEFTEGHMQILFGKDFTEETLFQHLDANNDGTINFSELMALAERRGIGIHTQYLGSGRQEIAKLKDYLGGIFNTLLLNIKRAFCEGDDVERTIIINTVYVKSTDFDTLPEDMDFLLEQGRRGVRAFLKYWKENHEDIPEKQVVDAIKDIMATVDY